jgi:hypothetical protein
MEAKQSRKVPPGGEKGFGNRFAGRPGNPNILLTEGAVLSLDHSRLSRVSVEPGSAPGFDRKPARIPVKQTGRKNGKI